LRPPLHRLNELKDQEEGRVLSDPALLLNMLKLYSEVFLDSAPCSTCEEKHKIYYRRLLREGEERIKKNNIMAERTCELKKNVCLYHEGNHYINANITDKVAREILKQNSQSEKNFKIYPKGYQVETEDAKVSDVKKNLAQSREVVAKSKEAVKKAEADLVKQAKEVEKLAVVLSVEATTFEAADDDQKEEAGKVAKKAEVAYDKALEDLVKAEEKIPGLNEQVDEAEANVVKYEALLNKRDK
jgi:hypothetical protein